MRFAIITSALLALLVLPGCATWGKEEVTVVDTYCLRAKKRAWSINDRPEAIREAVVWNRTIDRRCGIGRVAAQ